MNLSFLPNLITLMRIVLIVPVAITLLNGAYGTTLLLFAVASMSDGIDGYLARHFGWTSRLGSILDPIADKLLLIVTFLLLTYVGHFPFWLAAVVIGRDLIILCGAIAYHFLFGAYDFSPTYLGKISTSAQFVLVLIALLDKAVMPVGELTLDIGIGFVFFVSSISGLDYILTWGRKAVAAVRSKS